MIRVVHIRILVTVLFAAATGGAASSCVKLTGVHDGCAVTADCNSGRQCVAGVCQSPPTNQDGAGGARDSDAKSMSDGSDVAPQTGTDGPSGDMPVIIVPDAGPPVSDGRDDVPDASRDLPMGQDAFDSRPEVSPDASDADAADARDGDGGDRAGDVPPDLGSSQSPSCDLPANVLPALASASLPQDVTGTWQVCGDASSASPDILWLLGGTKTIHLDGFYWGRLAVGQTSQGNQDGMYFQVLEGTRSILQFVDINVAAGGGATLAANYFPSAGVLDFTSCDGARLCNSSVVRLVRMAAGAGQ